MSLQAQELALHIASELRDPEPKGFAFDESVVRQDAGLERLAEQLAREDGATVAAALSELLEREADGWTQLKLLELSDRLALRQMAEGLLRFVQAKASSGAGRDQFLAGRACEVLVKLPLDLQMRARANELSGRLLTDTQRYREKAQRVRSAHRPRILEWAILVAMMVLGVTGLWFALHALD